MARKNILSGLMDANKPAPAVPSMAPEPGQAAADERVQMTFKGVGALGAVTRSIDALAARADAAKAIEDKLAAGEVVVDLDPDQIEDSFVSDRLGETDAAFQELVEAIRARGQDSPILVRPHPTRDGQFQIAFGHRRARAAKALGRPVRAIVRRLDDRDHVIAQGQENAARADLSFIERTLFAAKLIDRGFDRETVMTALNADKTTVSKMLSVVKRIPPPVLATILGARDVGRDRWHELSALFEVEGAAAKALGLIAQARFTEASPDERFEVLVRGLRRGASVAATGVVAGPAPATWQRGEGAIAASIRQSGRQFTIALKAEKAAAFGSFIADRLDRLYEEFEASVFNQPTGD